MFLSYFIQREIETIAKIESDNPMLAGTHMEYPANINLVSLDEKIY